MGSSFPELPLASPRRIAPFCLPPHPNSLSLQHLRKNPMKNTHSPPPASPYQPQKSPHHFPRARPSQKSNHLPPPFHPFARSFSSLNHQPLRLHWIYALPASPYPRAFNSFHSRFSPKRCRQTLDSRTAQPDFQFSLTNPPEPAKNLAFLSNWMYSSPTPPYPFRIR